MSVTKVSTRHSIRGCVNRRELRLRADHNIAGERTCLSFRAKLHKFGNANVRDHARSRMVPGRPYAGLLQSIERLMAGLAELAQTKVPVGARHEGLMLTGRLPITGEQAPSPGTDDAYRQFAPTPEDWLERGGPDIVDSWNDLVKTEQVAFVAAVSRVAMRVVQESNLPTPVDPPTDSDSEPEDAPKPPMNRKQRLQHSLDGLSELSDRLKRSDADLQRFSERVAREWFHHFKFVAEFKKPDPLDDTEVRLTELREDVPGLRAEEKWT